MGLMVKPNKKLQADRHKSKFMARLPEVYRRQLQRLVERTRRAMTTEIEIALEKHLGEEGLWPPTEKT